jgi:hypothetical protein
MAEYDAFISYSHERDKALAAALQSFLQTIGKPWYARRACRVFRDDTSLAATPHLWPSIEEALSRSRFLILLASPEAAASAWVTREVAFWLEHKSADTILIALTSGRLAWDEADGDFFWTEYTPLPPVLKGSFAAEPKWVELHAFRQKVARRSSHFAERAADLAAAVQGVAKDDLLSTEVWQQRRALMLAYAAAAIMMVLGATSAWQWRSAAEGYRLLAEQRNLADAQRSNAERTILAASRTASTLIVEIAQEFRDRTSLPHDLVRKLLYRAQYLQDQLAESGDQPAAVQRSNLLVLHEIALTLQMHGDGEGALTVARRCVTIAQRLADATPADPERQRDLATSLQRYGDRLLAAGDQAQALEIYRRAVAVLEKLPASNPEAQQDLAAARKRIAELSEPAAPQSSNADGAFTPAANPSEERSPLSPERQN